MSPILSLQASIIFSMLLIGSFWSSNLHAQKVNRTKFKRDNRAPRITPDGENYDIPVSSDLQLSCSGSRKLEWKLPSTRNGEVEIVNTVEENNEKERQFGRPSKPGSTHRSELHIHSVKVTDTGVYRCFYDGEMDVEGSFSLINVFVNDPKQLYVPTAPPGIPMPTFVTVHEHKPGRIACRPTYSRAEVSLMKYDGEVIRDAPFYAAEGFTVPFPNVFFSGEFTCRYRVGDWKADQRLILHYIANTDAPMPVIDTSYAKHVTAGKSFQLMCNATVHHDTMLELNWDFPSPSTSQRATTVMNSYDRANANYRYTLLVNTVTIRDVDQNLDDGTYRCTAIVVSNREKRSSTEAKIKPFSAGIESHIKMTPKMNLVQVEIHQDAILAVTVDAHPPPTYIWKHNGVQIPSKMPRYTIVTDRDIARLRIAGAQGSDQGNFTLEAVAGETRSAVNITLLINESPTVSLDSSGLFYQVGRTTVFRCTVRGFPMPHTVWKFQPCHRECVENGWQDNNYNWNPMPAENVSTTTDLSGRTSTSRFHASINQLGSGYLRCETEHNNIESTSMSRSSHSTVRILATDIENGFKAEMRPNNPAELQNITITCVVNSYEFSEVQWEVLPPGGSAYRFVTPSNAIVSGILNTDNIFSNTYYLKMTHANGKDVAGQYRCVASRKNSGAPLRSPDFDLSNLRAAADLTFDDGNYGIEKKKVPYEGKMELDCLVSGSPPPQFQWKKDDVPVIESQVLKIENGGSRLVNYKVTPETEGKYTCRAFHPKSTVEKGWLIDVEGDGGSARKRNIIIGSVVAPFVVLMCGIVMFIWIKYRKEKTRRKELEYLEKIINNDTANPALIDPNAPLSDQVALLNYDDRWEIPRENLKLHNKILGSGQFGKVMRGEAKDLMAHPGELIVVAVKMLKEKADIVQRKALLGEIKVMMHIGKHLNVVNLLGACTKTITKGELFMIMEYCQNGSLQKFLQNHVGERFYNQLDLASMKIKPLGDDQLDEINLIKRRLEKSDNKFDGKIVTTRDLICYSFQVSNGMDYLAKHKIIHRDLAARNVLVAENDVVKICDFGLAREDYTYVKKSQAVIPVKWVAIESIYDNVFTTESDVWAFGIMMWEIFTLGSTPYPGHEANSTFVERVRNGLRMDHPYLAPKEIYDMMRHCWETSPYARPSFLALSAHLSNLLDQALVQRYLDLNAPFEQFNEEAHITDDAGYINDPVNRNSQISTENGVTYANSYRLLPGNEQPAPSKPRRYPRSTDGAGDTVDAMEMQPMLTRHSPKPSRPGNETDDNEYLNHDFINPRITTPAKAKLDEADMTALSTATVSPSESFASGRRYPAAGDARTNFLYGANPVRFPKTSKV